MIFGNRKSDMREAVWGHDPPSWGANEKSELYEIRFVDVFDGLSLFAGDGSDGLDASRTAVELLRDGSDDIAIGRLEADLVDFKKRERFAGDFLGDALATVYLGKITHPLEEAVRDARGFAASGSDSIRAPLVYRDIKDSCRTGDDFFHLRRWQSLVEEYRCNAALTGH